MREQGSMSESDTGRVQACSMELLQATFLRHLKVLHAVSDTSRCGTQTLHCSREHALNYFTLKQGQCCMACALRSRCCQEEDTVTDCSVLVIHTTRLSVNGANQWQHLILCCVGTSSSACSLLAEYCRFKQKHDSGLSGIAPHAMFRPVALHRAFAQCCVCCSLIKPPAPLQPALAVAVFEALSPASLIHQKYTMRAARSDGAYSH